MYKVSDKLLIKQIDDKYLLDFKGKHMILEHEEFPIPDYLIRVVEEYVNLRYKLDRLEHTIHRCFDNDCCHCCEDICCCIYYDDNISGEEINLLRMQQKCMRNYCVILWRRCELHNINVTDIYDKIIMNNVEE